MDIKYFPMNYCPNILVLIYNNMFPQTVGKHDMETF